MPRDTRHRVTSLLARRLAIARRLVIARRRTSSAVRVLLGRPRSYVSDELSHFVGYGHVDDDERNWEILQTIIDSRELLAGGKGGHGAGASTLTINTHERLTSNNRYLPSMVCFADIPADMLDIHSAKYGKFGLGFARSWLIEQGTRPVTYVPCGVQSTPLSRLPTLDEEWEDLMKTLDWAVLRRFGGDTKALSDDDQERIEEFIDGQRRYMKFFNPALAAGDLHNYYLEREWRAITGIEFAETNIAQVFVPVGWRAVAERRYPDLAAKVVAF